VSALSRLGSILSTSLLGVFSLGVWLVALVWMSSVATIALLLTPFVSFKRSHPYLGAPGMATCVRLTFSRLRVTRDPGFDPERRSVFCQNHVSVLDGHVACGAIPHAFCGLMNHTHFRIPGYGWIMKLARGIPVYPRASGRTAEISEAARERAAYGISILTFPEAHRTLDGNVREFRRGVFFMARDAGLPVVPLAVRGLYAINRKGSWLFRPGTVDVYLGPQIETAGLNDEQVGELATRVQSAIDTYVRTGTYPQALSDPTPMAAEPPG
jgi:1-acyl-sn-glycerol-3-phosphate acyltransferase